MEPCEAQDYAIRSRVAVDRTMRPGNWLVDKLRLNFATDIHVLLHDPAAIEWALWQASTPGGGVNCVRVHWDGEVEQPLQLTDAPWLRVVTDRVQAYLISREQAETLVMLARHMHDKTAWANAAMRWGRNHGGQMVRCTHA